MTWNLCEKNEENPEFLKPLEFSNGKTQEDVVKETLNLIKQGEKIIFIKGVCGTGKSAIALNLAKEIGKASIVVPVKALQKQYELDYTHNKYLLKENGEKLKINSLTGRANFKCPYLEENPMPKTEEKNSTLDIFDFKRYEPKFDKTCNNPFLPCKIDIKDKNTKYIKHYLKQNPKVRNTIPIDKVRRLSIAPVCPYWSPLMPAEINLNILENAELKNYKGLKNKDYVIYQRKKGCGYYDQYQAYLDADVLIFNSLKYIIETAMNRKPETEIEIIDECDEFLDSFSNQKTINFSRLYFALSSLFTDDAEAKQTIRDITNLTRKILKSTEIKQLADAKEILNLTQTPVIDILDKFLDSDLMNYVECDEENYCYKVEEVARIFENFLSETYITFSRHEKSLYVKLVTTNLEKKFKELLEKNKVFVLMSGTIHSEQVLKQIFGIENFKIINAETQTPGKITELKTGSEINCKYSNFANGIVNREQYLKALDKCIEKSPKPALVHVNSFRDLPSDYEKENLNLKIMSKQELDEMQSNETFNKNVKDFKNGKFDVLYSTKCNRGMDFPGNQCKSIILTKFPYPDISSLFWRVLKKVHPEFYNSFYMDKARREFLQRIYRALRFKNDHIFLLSPDIRVFYNKQLIQ